MENDTRSGLMGGGEIGRRRITMSPPNRDVHVLYWNYGTSGENCIVRAYQDKDRAEADLKLMTEHCLDKAWNLVTLPVFE